MAHTKLLSWFSCWGLISGAISTSTPKCKVTPGTELWPVENEWRLLNQSLSGQLLKTVPPGAICHPTQPTFDALACPSVQAGWLTAVWHTNDPVSVLWNNWNNDTCLPYPTAPCSSQEYPVYVINATSAQDVQEGINFARKNNVRLIVKGTGHDYLGRSVAPNALSIWTHHIKGITFHDTFSLEGCRKTFSEPSITVAAGVQMVDLDEQAHLRNLTIVGGGGGSVGVGGYFGGGGHSALSSTYGMAADQVLEMEVVTSDGRILTINECQNRDLFWAFRGGGGSTFGIMTSVTIRAYPSTKFVTVDVQLGTLPGNEAFWDVFAYIMSRVPELDSQGISFYSQVGNSMVIPELNLTSPAYGWQGLLLLPLLHPSNSSDSVVAAIQKVINEATAPFPGQFFSATNAVTHDDFWGYYKDGNGPRDAGFISMVLTSRLLDEKALANSESIIENYKVLVQGSVSVMVYLVGGKGVMNAKPRGGSNAINPAWRRAYIHTLTGDGWLSFTPEATKLAIRDRITNVLGKALRNLAPDMGAYINEADPNEPNFQQAFWGYNYARLLKIKRKIDPTDVFWCNPCVGNEKWAVVDDVLCKV